MIYVKSIMLLPINLFCDLLVYAKKVELNNKRNIIINDLKNG